MCFAHISQPGCLWWSQISTIAKKAWSLVYIPNDAGLGQKKPSTFSGLLLQKVNNGRKLIFELCLPQDLKICLISQSSPKNNIKPMCIILSFFKKWTQNARSKLDYQPFICITCVGIEVAEPSGPPPPPKKTWGQSQARRIQVLGVACRFEG